MQTPFEHGDKMEVCLFEKKENFFITKISEFRDGAGFQFKTIEIDRINKPQAPPQTQLKKEGPVLTMNNKRPALGSAPNKQIAGNAAQLPAGKVQPKPVAANGARQVNASGTKQVSGSGAKQLPAGGPKQVTGSGTKQVSGSSTKQVAGSGAKQLPAGGPKQISPNANKKLAAQDAAYLPAGKKK
ncbi:hypothetical protein MmiHf6_04440 [Methanimicrococcus hongohii]|uniref:Uncharacterized protein n=1 Tax=Methanimicrococcus hongohii TaxID=3028295 RepID=A0AA96UYQ7_9EURY|nr:hypothetical protein [Methanimicrococcus sp. Hf6]WNY23141.1 hypothetical protein MmiHf6_04440 [Methanimicrococcus sp. Hf6]